jgi:type IV pilus assembly protein PilX
MSQNTIEQKGFILAIAMIFLLILTVLAITSIKRATVDEKVSGNLRAQNLAFQAAESALRFCQKNLELSGPGGTLPLTPGTTETLNHIPILIYPNNVAPAITPPAPIVWTDLANWTNVNAVRLPANTIPNVAIQPQCMIEEWPMKDLLKPKIYTAYVITARGVGATANAVVWLQETLRVGTAIN